MSVRSLPGETCPSVSGCIYTLRAPGEAEIRYVGQTADPLQRLSEHNATGRAYLSGLRRRRGNDGGQLELALDPGPREYSACSRPARAKSSLPEWLAALVAGRMRPVMEIVERVACPRPCDCWPGGTCRRLIEREAYWIEYFRGRGAALLNRLLPSRRGRSRRSRLAASEAWFRRR